MAEQETNVLAGLHGVPLPSLALMLAMIRNSIYADGQDETKYDLDIAVVYDCGVMKYAVTAISDDGRSYLAGEMLEGPFRTKDSKPYERLVAHYIQNPTKG